MQAENKVTDAAELDRLIAHERAMMLRHLNTAHNAMAALQRYESLRAALDAKS